MVSICGELWLNVDIISCISVVERGHALNGVCLQKALLNLLFNSKMRCLSICWRGLSVRRHNKAGNDIGRVSNHQIDLCLL